MGLVDPLYNILQKIKKSSPSLPPTSTSSTLIEKIVDATDEYIVMSDVVKQELEEVLISELLHRIDETIVFVFLDDTDLKSIARHIVDQTVKRAQKVRIYKTASLLCKTSLSAYYTKRINPSSNSLPPRSSIERYKKKWQN